MTAVNDTDSKKHDEPVQETERGSKETTAKSENADANPDRRNNSNKQQIESIAIQILSPGLPLLKPVFEEALARSKTIEEQQKDLIAKREQGVSERADQESFPPLDSVGEDLADKPQQPRSATRLPNKSLKRRNAPPPLNIANGNHISNPSIRSAPIRTNLHYTQQGQGAGPERFRKRRLPFSGQPPLTSVPQGGFRSYPFPQAQPTAGFAPMPFPVYGPEPHYIVPHSALMAQGCIVPNNVAPGVVKQSRQPPMGNQQPQQVYTSARQAPMRHIKMQVQQESPHVTDVFSNDTKKVAPLTSQPLSAQQETFAFFGENENLVEKDNSDSNEKEDKEEEGDGDVESRAIEDEYKPSTKARNIEGELRIDSEQFAFTFQTGGDPETDKTNFINTICAAWDEYRKNLG
ncbi:Hypothetical protein PP7435_CHR4-0917 [Komagataella phaffii CBS 7435]|uniref:Uncharacterized protein n=2 Tax=Komagataella phaffii TaxID=460519 RepID=C4R6V0_KOMPG|nr:Hypothetical protein PAS_chr4_0099 [Komagataella phaffii GS115]AOA64650.1 GQ67_04409T0 [Komagataella phaffii]CAH2451330.1 Hypothetical protein BQ9382_C4-4800 [Komagataella phaffii CBS 7435]AOA69615.1 GQ68_04381T0 [Komagataella phaffii GS115]CAY71325.1 Hypothetical protein PAS_chr4_0099 [Komagataella phaffii GS115]CCA41068.1 Hypothetical protein PP7435_CHR4-0917 [Komagataella phaffii CBS 7435]